MWDSPALKLSPTPLAGFGGELTTWNGNHLQTSPQFDFQMARSRLEDEVSCNFDLSENEAHFFANERRIHIF